MSRWTHLPALIAFVVIAAAWMYAENQNRKIFEQQMRAQTLHHVSLLRAKLEGHINGNIQLVRGLIATFASEPDMTQERFDTLVSALMSDSTQLRNLAAAPGMVVSLVHPMDGNESVLGLDYTTNVRQRGGALRARDSGDLVLAGPLNLVQGGRGLIGRFPVFTSEDGERRFWGIVSAVVDVDMVYRDSGLLDEALPVEVALSGADGLGEAGALFFGSADVIADDPVVMDVVVPSGTWQIHARPLSGWDVQPRNIWSLRALLLIASALIMVPAVMTGRLIEERQHNIRELQRREMELRRLSRRLGLALETSKVGVWDYNIDDQNLVWDDRMNELYGYPADDGPRDYHSWARRLHPDDEARASEDFRVAVESRGSYDSNYRLVLPDGSIRHIRALGTVYRDAGAPARIVGVNWDVTQDVMLNKELTNANRAAEARNRELEATRARIEYNALHDPLTGLPNRRYLDEMMAEHADRFAAGSEVAALLQIDLDRFKQINDTLGHAAGDAMLVHAAAVLGGTVGPRDFLARIGGDEFVILCRRPAHSGGDGLREMADLARRVIADMQSPLYFEGHECRVGVSIGIAGDMDGAADPRRLAVNADIALYRAKSGGRNRFQFFNEALQTELVATKRIADDILTGLEQRQFVAHYQPQFSASTLDIVGVEALARWHHPQRGLLAPHAFMQIAEELNVVASIDRMVLEDTLAEQRRWRAEGLAIPKASVNVSARRLHDEELVRSLRELDIEPGTISFELVESIFLDEKDDMATWNIDHVKALGIDIEIDDFGTGYASIVSLMKLRPKRLKIDRQLVLPIVRSPGQRQLVGSIIDIGKSLGIEVLAEGVETMEHARILRKLGCDALQGYAFARPMSAEDLSAFVRSSAWRKAS